MKVNVSVVIPARNEQASIAALLDSLLEQTYPPSEIVVVDAGSVDRTAAIVRRYRSAKIPVRLVSIGAAFPGIARNAGVAEAVSEYIAFTDAGIQVDRHWLEKLCAALDPVPGGIGQPPDVVFGSYEPVIGTFFAQCAAAAYIPAKSQKKGREVRGPVIASCLIRRSVIDRATGFPPYRAAEDLVFFDRIRGLKCTVAYAPEAVVHWQLAASWRSTYQRFALYSYHNLIARRARYWHHRVARFYVLAALFLILACADRVTWLAIPVSGACARVGLTIWRKRKERWGAAWNPLRWIVVGLVLLLLDAATLAGALRWAWDRLRGRLPRCMPAQGEPGREATAA